jgi:hypothetical protein
MIKRKHSCSLISNLLSYLLSFILFILSIMLIPFGYSFGTNGKP